jgi:hypothetical protein
VPQRFVFFFLFAFFFVTIYQYFLRPLSYYLQIQQPLATTEFERNCMCKSGAKHACHLCNQPENKCSVCNNGFNFDIRYSVCCPNQTATIQVPTQPTQAISSSFQNRTNIFWYVVSFTLLLISCALLFGATLFCFRKRKNKFVHAQEYDSIPTTS